MKIEYVLPYLLEGLWWLEMFAGAIYTYPCLCRWFAIFSSFSFIPLVWLTSGVGASSFYELYARSCSIFFPKHVYQFIIQFGPLKSLIVLTNSKSRCTEKAYFQKYL